ncbi:hypothetical protein BDR06DRAFT_152851 [Suillus hirtellus]|nr:hypothetical protein BDR06DRAFT_152851 [Suillus hirtellus]
MKTYTKRMKKIADVDTSSGISVWWRSHLKLAYSSAVVLFPPLVPPFSAIVSSGSSALNTAIVRRVANSYVAAPAQSSKRSLLIFDPSMRSLRKPTNPNNAEIVSESLSAIESTIILTWTSFTRPPMTLAKWHRLIPISCTSKHFMLFKLDSSHLHRPGDNSV